MLTVIVAFDGSRNSSTCRPLASRYSVMPSTVVTCAMFCEGGDDGCVDVAAQPANAETAMSAATPREKVALLIEVPPNGLPLLLLCKLTMRDASSTAPPRAGSWPARSP